MRNACGSTTWRSRCAARQPEGLGRLGLPAATAWIDAPHDLGDVARRVEHEADQRRRRTPMLIAHPAADARPSTSGCDSVIGPSRSEVAADRPRPGTSTPPTAAGGGRRAGAPRSTRVRQPPQERRGHDGDASDHEQVRRRRCVARARATPRPAPGSTDSSPPSSIGVARSPGSVEEHRRVDEHDDEQRRQVAQRLDVERRPPSAPASSSTAGPRPPASPARG